MGGGESLLEAPKLQPPTMALPSVRTVMVNGESGPVCVSYRVYREDLRDARNGVVVWQHAYGETGVTVWETGKVDMLEGYCVIVPEVPIEAIEPTYNVTAALAQNINAILDEEDLRKAHYIGYGMGGYIGWCLLAHSPKRWLSMAIGGWSPAGRSSWFEHWASANAAPWMNYPLPNLETQLAECSNKTDGYPRVLLWASELDGHIADIRSCSLKYSFPLATSPQDYVCVGSHAAAIPEIRADLLRGLEPWYVWYAPLRLDSTESTENERLYAAWAVHAHARQRRDLKQNRQTLGMGRRRSGSGSAVLQSGDVEKTQSVRIDPKTSILLNGQPYQHKAAVILLNGQRREAGPQDYKLPTLLNHIAAC